jgi:hypothetical protein
VNGVVPVTRKHRVIAGGHAVDGIDSLRVGRSKNGGHGPSLSLPSLSTPPGLPARAVFAWRSHAAGRSSTGGGLAALSFGAAAGRGGSRVASSQSGERHLRELSRAANGASHRHGAAQHGVALCAGEAARGFVDAMSGEAIAPNYGELCREIGAQLLDAFAKQAPQTCLSSDRPNAQELSARRLEA